MVELLVGAVILVSLGIVVLRLLALPSAEDEEELAGFVAGNWERLQDAFTSPDRNGDGD